jgi:hypothetical protein
MTKVQLQYALTRPLDEHGMNAIANAHAYYGILLVKLSQNMDRILVEYDASRLTPSEVLATLQRSGIPAQEVEQPA